MATDITGLRERGSYKSAQTVLERHPLYLADSRQDMAAILAAQGIRRLPFVGGADIGLTVSYQGNPQLGHISHSPLRLMTSD